MAAGPRGTPRGAGAGRSLSDQGCQGAARGQEEHVVSPGGAAFTGGRERRSAARPRGRQGEPGERGGAAGRAIPARRGAGRSGAAAGPGRAAQSPAAGRAQKRRARPRRRGVGLGGPGFSAQRRRDGRLPRSSQDAGGCAAARGAGAVGAAVGGPGAMLQRGRGSPRGFSGSQRLLLRVLGAAALPRQHAVVSSAGTARPAAVKPRGLGGRGCGGPGAVGSTTGQPPGYPPGQPPLPQPGRGPAPAPRLWGLFPASFPSRRAGAVEAALRLRACCVRRGVHPGVNRGPPRWAVL